MSFIMKVLYCIVFQIIPELLMENYKRKEIDFNTPKPRFSDFKPPRWMRKK